jgi:GAF domain-containing protein/HAMP domain-containing protein
MKKIQNLKIKSKIGLIIGVNLFFILLLGIAGKIGLGKIDWAKEEIITNSDGIYHQLTADMMHDALRADVYKSLLLDSGDMAGRQEVRHDLDQHREAFEQALSQLEKLPLEAGIKDAARAVKAPLDKYIASSANIAELALSGDSTSKVIARQKLAEHKIAFDELASKMAELSKLIADDSERKREEATSIANFNELLTYGVTLLALVLSVSIGVFISKALIVPIIQAKNILLALSKGQLPNEKLIAQKDEIGEMAQALFILMENLRNVRSFALAVGEGNFETQITVFHNEGELGTALAGMRESLQKVASADARRNWASTGVAQMIELQRAAHQHSSELYNRMLAFLVNYAGANQGGLFLLNKADKGGPFIEMVACYAYSRQKFLTKTLQVGEGLIGQTMLEQKTTYITKLPGAYIELTSGLGEATPDSLLIVPLVLNNEVLGALELASFTLMDSHQIEWLEKMAENLAATISAHQTSEQTKELLIASQRLSEELQAQEEEVRQNMEELQATQEEMRRRERDYLQTIASLEEKVALGKSSRLED